MSRKLHSLLADIIELRQPLTRAQIVNANPNLLVSMAMTCFMGTLEKTGNNDGAVIDAFNWTTGTVPRSSYCQNAYQAAVRWVENVRGLVSPLYCSGNSQDVYYKSPSICRVDLKDIKQGDALIAQHGTTSSGHTAPVLQPHVELGFAFTTEANTSGGPGINTNGNGDFFRMRSLDTTGKELHWIGAVRAFPDFPIQN
jgi:hypothetical protein